MGCASRRVPASDRLSPSGTPLVVLNFGRGTIKEDLAFSFPITGRYRCLPEPLTSACGDSAAAAAHPNR